MHSRNGFYALADYLINRQSFDKQALFLIFFVYKMCNSALQFNPTPQSTVLLTEMASHHRANTGAAKKVQVFHYVKKVLKV